MIEIDPTTLARLEQGKIRNKKYEQRYLARLTTALRDLEVLSRQIIARTVD